MAISDLRVVWMLRLEYEWVSNLKLVPLNCLKINVSSCVKNSKFRTKNALFRYFLEQIEKDIAIFVISTLKVKSFMQNVRNFNLEPKLPSLDWHLKNYGHIWNQHPRICRNVKFQKNVQNPKFSTKNTLFGYVWNITLINYCRIWNLPPQIYIST